VRVIRKSREDGIENRELTDNKKTRGNLEQVLTETTVQRVGYNLS
jgi:hypothetical protein